MNIMFKRYILSSLILLATTLFLTVSPMKAFEIVSDPIFIVINFSDSFHALNWYAPENEWQQVVKPQAKQRLRDIKRTLSYEPSQSRYVLAWSTLMEYTNYPLDKPSDTSPYIIRMKRMLELAEEENFPIFVPLNGVQWWDEVPELWNYWDPDGNQTPGCRNNEYTHIDGYNTEGKPIYRCKFEKLRDPIYRERFIKGYDSDNKWNVDWQDWETPIKLTLRNWGGGDILVAPPPNIIDHHGAVISFFEFQTERYKALVDIISQTGKRWEKEGKLHLFAGMAIGTEVSLYGSIDTDKNEIKLYGFRAMQDIFCPDSNPTCGKDENWNKNELRQKREAILSNYFNNLAKIAHDKGIPKQRVYSHVWNEMDEGMNDYMDLLKASITLYSRPGQSAYKIANNPLYSSSFKETLKENGYISWAAPEFAPLVRDEQNWRDALKNTFHSIAPPKVIDIYNETDILNTAAIPELKALLQEKELYPICSVSEVIPLAPETIVDPYVVKWDVLNNDDNAEFMEILFWDRDQEPATLTEAQHAYLVKKDTLSFKVPKNMQKGKYYWAVKRIGCIKSKWTISNLHHFMIQSSEDRSLSENLLRWLKDLFNRNRF